MKNSKIFIRVDGSPNIGLGHIYRSIALAQMLDEIFEIVFYCAEIPVELSNSFKNKFGYKLFDLTQEDEFLKELKRTNGQVIVVLDGYHFDTGYQKSIKDTGAKVVCIDDVHQIHFSADAVINHAPGITSNDYSTDNYTSLYLGPNYALLRAGYLDLTKTYDRCQTLETVFICFGGADPKNITEKTIQVLAREELIKKAIVVTGAGYETPERIANINNKSMLSIEHHHDINDDQMTILMRRSDFAIVPSSTILYEVMAARLPVVTGYYIENQTQIYKGFRATGAVLGVGRLSEESISQGISELTVEKAQNIQSRQLDVIDGQSAKRIREIFNYLIA